MADKRVLVVDDEPDIRLMLRLLIEAQEGYVVEEAVDGVQALARLRTQHYDLMFLDLLMPDIDGREVLDRLPPELKSTMPIVVLTALNEDNSVMHGYEQGATLYLTKPFANDAVIDVLRYFTADLSEAERAAIEARL